MNIVQYPKKISIKTINPKQYVVWHGSFSRTKYTPYGGRAVKPTALIDLWAASSEKIGAPYLINRDGTIYKVFEDSEWIHHLGLKGSKGMDTFYDKRSIPIVIANELQLIKENGQYYAFDYVSHLNCYNGPISTCDWHSYKYWAKVEDAQYDALLCLTKDICERHNIDPIVYTGKETGAKIWEKATIFTHSALNPTVNDFPPFSPTLIAKIKDFGFKVID